MNSNILKSGVAAIASGALALSSTSCQPNAATGAATGAALGAGIGALAGDDNIAEGAIAGAVIGGVVGAAAKAKRVRNQQQLSQPQSYPWGRHSDDPGYVYSPYAPNNLVDVRGFYDGELVVDPTTGGVFRVP
ncbi:MAG: YMGG-like glycine zipper-containing protein [Verrucomicrobiota bacterium]